MHDSRLEAVVLTLFVDIRPSLARAEGVDARPAGNNNHLIEELKRGDGIVLVLEEILFPLSCRLVRKLLG